MKKKAGYTLIELSIALVILGVVIMLVWRFVGYNAQYATSNSERNILRSADMAITGFALAHDRMPCPDTSGDGLEDCAGAAVGELPSVSLGMSQITAGQIRYGVYRNAVVPAISDADLAVAKDRMPMLATHNSPLVGFDLVRNQSNGIDLCVALRNASNYATSNPNDTARLHVLSPSPENAISVAYALAIASSSNADETGGLLDAGNDGTNLAFEAPSRVTDGTYDDRVVAVGFDRLNGRLNCNETLAATTHANANAATAAEIMHQAMIDYKIQLDLIAKLAEANYAGALASVALGVAGVATGAAEIALAIAESIETLGAAAPIAALAIAAEVAAAIALASALINLIPATDAWNHAKDNVTRFATEGYITRSGTLATDFRNNANAGDAAGTY